MKPFNRLVSLIALCGCTAFAAHALPAAAPNPSCPLTADLDVPIQQLLDFLSTNHVPLPEDFDYRYADMELGVGDGLPDHFQLMLLSAALCTGDPDLNAQFAANQTQIANYVTLLDQFTAWLDAFRVHAATAAQEIRLLTQWPSYSLYVPAETQVQVEQALQVLDAFSRLNEQWPDVTEQLNLIRQQLASLVDQVAATAALSTEMLQTFQDAIHTNLIDRIASYQAEITGLSTTLQAATGLAGFLQLLGYTNAPLLQAALTDIVNDVQTLQTILAALPFPNLGIYGAQQKAAGEPFSASGDYDGDGKSNLDAYQIVQSNPERFGAAVPAFVQAASGADPFYQAESVPAAGIVGLGILAAVITLAGALIMLKR